MHLTTVPLHGGALDAYRAACTALRVKALVIELSPALPVQPMTCLRVTGSFADAMAEAARVRDLLAAQGFPTTRVKVEAAPWNPGVPVTDAQGMAEPPGRYFEYHARLTLPDGADLSGLREACAQHRAHVSRNPLKVREDGLQERFVTLRAYGVGREAVEARAAELEGALRRAGWTVASTVLEYCVHDDHLALDGGWGQP
ncbi:hypothetical protein [Deinococcus maricopensis]|uniref:Ankyrin n=1 Tax=Deinococcus maricopensis (strain DSM 21211 / LMG 22137 / NRRL B-23946 / LB-34) TaxID=709986 RepID=E8U8X2_DEIML|nr:hypothetical protein [Deinococcus maricopensis]ADV67511.1 hypothetical protein Deima_1864 [Deinococcus maricopensis DSM 21211]